MSMQSSAPADRSAQDPGPQRNEGAQSHRDQRPGTLHLIPVPIGSGGPGAELPAPLIALTARLDYLIAENAKTARAFLKRLPLERPLQVIEIREFNEHTPLAAIPALIAPLLAGRDAGLVSEAGCPAVADPGSQLVAAAHQAGIPVMPHIGPSALLLTLMASGLEGQRFAFAGYLPAQPQARAIALQRLEQRSAREHETQLWIETPYRAQAMVATAIQTLASTTRLAIACDLALAQQWIASKTVADWRKQMPEIADRLTVFALLADGSSRLTAQSGGGSVSASAADRARPQTQSPSPPRRQSALPGARPHSPVGKSRRRSPP